GDLEQLPVVGGCDPIHQRRGDQRLADPRPGRPLGTRAEQVVDDRSQVVVRVHQPRIGGDDAVPVGVGVIARGDVIVVAGGDEAGPRIGGGAVHADVLSPVERHERPGGIDIGVDDGEVEIVVLGDGRPEVDTGPAQGVGADPQPGAADDVEVDDGAEVIDVVRDVVEVLSVLQVEGALETGARDLLPPVGQVGVGAVGDPGRGLGAGRSAVGRVVLDAAVGGRVVAGGDDDAVGLGIGAGLP